MPNGASEAVLRFRNCDRADGDRNGVHLASHEYWIALIRPDAARVYGKGTRSYFDLGDDEVRAGNGYQRGGKLLGPLVGPTWADVFARRSTWADAVWFGTIAAVGALVYNASLPDKNALLVVSFGENFDQPVRSSNANFVLPAEVIRLALARGDAASRGEGLAYG